MSVYGYYIKILANRRGIELIKTPRSIKTDKVKRVFDKQFYKACVLLGWNTHHSHWPLATHN